MKIITQLCFDGEADAALELYCRAFGCSVRSLMHYRDAVAYGWEQPDEEKNNRVYHCEIVSGEQEIRLIDLAGEEQVRLTKQVTHHVQFDTEEEVRAAFTVLSEDGRVVRELEKPPFLVIIGEVIDRFGVRWVLMCDYK